MANEAIVVAIVIAIVTAIIGMIQFYKIYNKTSKTESAKFIFELNKRFLEEPFKTISYNIGRDIAGIQTFEIKTNDNKRDINNYLSELEVDSQFYLDGVLTKKQTYEVLGTQILESMQAKAINDFIKNERKKPDSKDLYDNLEKTVKDMKEYQKKKFSE